MWELLFLARSWKGVGGEGARRNAFSRWMESKTLMYLVLSYGRFSSWKNWGGISFCTIRDHGLFIGIIIVSVSFLFFFLCFPFCGDLITGRHEQFLMASFKRNQEYYHSLFNGVSFFSPCQSSGVTNSFSDDIEWHVSLTDAIAWLVAINQQSRKQLEDANQQQRKKAPWRRKETLVCQWRHSLSNQ